jgi:hypothetical protein
MRYISEFVENSRSIDLESQKMIIDGDKSMFSRGMIFRAMNDLKYLLSHSAVAIALVTMFEKKKLFF